MPYRDHTKKSDSVKHWTGLFLIEIPFSLRRFRGGCFVAAGCWAPIVERGGLLAGAAHPRRQKHREMPPPGASAPAFAATVEPTFTQITSDLPPTYLQSDSSNERVLKVACCVHRFLISGPDLRIDARFSRFTATCVHRFLISCPNLGIDARCTFLI